MYECCNVKRFFRLLILDAIIFGMCLIFFYIGKTIVFSAAEEDGGVPMPAIMYHSVCNNESNQYSVTPSQLEADLKYLSDHGYSAVSAEQLVMYTHGKGELPEKPVLITFDDGCYNNLSLALPLLEKYDMKAIVSIVGSYTNKLAQNDPHNDRYSYLTWEDASELTASGRVELGSHTYDMHSNTSGRKGCSRNSGENIADYTELLGRDIGLMQTEFLENLGQLPIVFAYPFGHISPEALPVLRENGFLITLTCYERPNRITRDPNCLYGIDRYNRSGLLSTSEFMERALNT